MCIHIYIYIYVYVTQNRVSVIEDMPQTSDIHMVLPESLLPAVASHAFMFAALAKNFVTTTLNNFPPAFHH